MIFEVGKFYRHTDIENYLGVRGRLPTAQYGETMIAEVWPNYLESLMAVGQDEAAAVNYVEISEAEWLRLFVPEHEAMV